MEGVHVSNLTSEVRNLMRNPQLEIKKIRTEWHGTFTPSKSPRHIVEDKDISAYRFTTSAQCHGTKTGSVPDCSALRYWESGTEGGRVSVISEDRNRVEFQLDLVISVKFPRILEDLGIHGKETMQQSDSAIVQCLRRPMPCAAG